MDGTVRIALVGAGMFWGAAHARARARRPLHGRQQGTRLPARTGLLGQRTGALRVQPGRRGDAPRGLGPEPSRAIHTLDPAPTEGPLWRAPLDRRHPRFS